ANGGSDQSRRVASTSLLDEAPRDALGAGPSAGDPAESDAAESNATESDGGTAQWDRRGGRGYVHDSSPAGGAPAGDPDEDHVLLEGELVEGDPPETGPGPEPRPAAGPAAPRRAGA
ncbi:MAG: hypothetical protein ABWX68_03845, partial [Arthrobacter sp.]|uniref:hypothetical protein n=1 Tax=Arthrobacter sp. TaxID=1667 RepID=UPI003477D3D1